MMPVRSARKWLHRLDLPFRLYLRDQNVRFFSLRAQQQQQQQQQQQPHHHDHQHVNNDNNNNNSSGSSSNNNNRHGWGVRT